MRKYKSAGFRHFHGEMKDLYERRDITAEKLREFEQNCFKSDTGTPQGRGAAVPAMAASPGPGRSGK
ncbi:hypothetical protein FACS189450_07560 [Spirochaetia bacterium]|nr:hypothetical protein FACS189450_07560 [Spirochaetia bacterium]